MPCHCCYIHTPPPPRKDSCSTIPYSSSTTQKSAIHHHSTCSLPKSKSTRTLQPHKTNKRWSFDCLPFRTELDTHIHQELITSLGNSIVLRKLNSQLPGFLLLYWEDTTRYNQSSLAHGPILPPFTTENSLQEQRVGERML
jgi:hypothetical protein